MNLINQVKSVTPPKHAWDYETFRLMVEQDADIIRKKERFPAEKRQRLLSTSIDLSEDAIDDYTWDDSIEQFTLFQITHRTVPPRNLFTCNDTGDNLTSSLTEASYSDDEVFHNPNPPSRSNRFRRINVLRKRRVRRTSSFTNPLSSDTDHSPED